MVKAMLQFWRSAAEMFSGHEKGAADLHRIGDYYADYSELTPDEIEAAKAACADHIARSKVISVKSGL